MSVIVGVHGIAQEQLGQHQLEMPWRLALEDGLLRAAKFAIESPSMTIAFYGDTFLRRYSDLETKAFTDTEDLEQADFSQEDIDITTAAACEVVPDADWADQIDSTKGVGRVPLPLQAVLRALDRRFGSLAGALFVGELRQVRRYLSDSDVKSAVDAEMAAAVAPDCTILIAHSLGSVVAFEFLRQHPNHQVELLLTLGSPLGLKVIRHSMPDPTFGTEGGRPANVRRWTNLYDPRDPVACVGDLKPWWPGTVNRRVDNGSSAHAVTNYLGKQECGRAILDVLQGPPA